MRRLLLTLCAIAVAGAAEAACPAVPFVFTDGTPIRGSQVNANFTALRNCVSAAVPIQSVTNSQAVRDLQAGIYPAVQKSYNTSQGDGSAVYYWNAGSSCTDDGQSCIKPTSNPATGRWVVSSEAANALLLKGAGGASEFTIRPTNTISSILNFQSTASGTVTSTPTDTGSMAMWWLKHEGALKGGGLNRQIALFEANYVDTTSGANNNDTYNGVIGNCNMTTTKTGGGQPGTSCVGVTAAARAWAPQGGTLGSESGGVHGINVVSGLSDFGTTPTNYNNIVGGEADLIGCTGCTVKVRWGWGAIDWGDGFNNTTATEKGSSVDAAFVVGSVAGPNYGWRYGIDFVGQPIYGGNSLMATGTVLGSSNSVQTVAAYGIDLNNFVIANSAFRGPAGTFTVSGTGNLTAQVISSQSGGMTIDAVLASPAVLQLRSATTPKWEIIREATTNDFLLSNLAAATSSIRVTPANVIGIGGVGAVTVNATGGVLMPGGGLAVGNPAGSLKGAGTINVQTAYYLNNVVGVSCTAGTLNPATTVVAGGIIVAC